MTPPSIQNLKAIGLWVFFLICCSTFSFNVGLRLTLGYLTLSLMKNSRKNAKTASKYTYALD